MTKKEKKYLVKVLSEASRISFSLIIYPILTLLLGVALDKKFSTTPLFIVISIISGLLLMIYSFKKLDIKEIK